MGSRLMRFKPIDIIIFLVDKEFARILWIDMRGVGDNTCFLA